jgi:hypothetical protein
MDHLFARVVEQLIARVTGPMKFRLFLQPAMAIFFAVRGGLKDAREGRPPYFWGLFTDRGERESMLKNGWKSCSTQSTNTSRCGGSIRGRPCWSPSF